eukprot:2083761-Pleurochrysis_carterae.AAC.1
MANGGRSARKATAAGGVHKMKITVRSEIMRQGETRQRMICLEGGQSHRNIVCKYCGERSFHREDY